MSKKMTPCEKLGYKVGDKFTVIKDSYFGKGTIVALSEDDGSEVPWFTCGGVRRALIIGSNPDVEPTPSKLKPAKQALADAIHQNGGWIEQANYAVQSGGNLRIHFTDDDKKPVRCAGGGWKCQYGFMFLGSTIPLKSKLKNWHQCILSRDEYFTAYPEQVKVEICNETKHKVEVEMESESEATINASDWHKSGELPPVGEVCLWIGRKENGVYRADLRTGERVEVIAHYKPRSDGPMVAVFAYESRGLIGRQTDQSIAKCFSPLRAEREKAIDEMVGCLGSRWDNCEEIAALLYENGCRKEVK